MKRNVSTLFFGTILGVFGLCVWPHYRLLSLFIDVLYIKLRLSCVVDFHLVSKSEKTLAILNNGAFVFFMLFFASNSHHSGRRPEYRCNWEHYSWSQKEPDAEPAEGRKRRPSQLPQMLPIELTQTSQKIDCMVGPAPCQHRLGCV